MFIISILNHIMEVCESLVKHLTYIDFASLSILLTIFLQIWRPNRLRFV